jgi:tetratricopeptide (TPR) repeat protein
MTSFFMDWDWRGAERSFRRAIELNPNSSATHQFYAHLLSSSGRHGEAIGKIQKALDIDPMSPMMQTFAGGIFALAGRYDDALPPIQQSLTVDPDLFPTHSVLGLFYEQTGKPDAAIEEYRTAFRLSGGNITQLAYQGFVFAQTGRHAEAKRIITTLNQIAQKRFVPPFTFALIYTGLGERDAAFEWLEKAYAVREMGLILLPADPRWDTLRSDKRFQSLLRRCGFQE